MKSNTKLEKAARLMQDLTPENPANIYDFAGREYNDILDVYSAGNYQHHSIAEINQQIKVIAAQNSNGMPVNLSTNSPTNMVVIQEIIDNPRAKLDQTIVNSSMTSAAKNSLSNFMNDVLLRENNSCGEILQFITAYESAVVANPTFRRQDKKIILTNSSIIRYSVYDNRKRKDKDWDTSVGHRARAIRGANSNSSIVIKCSFVTAIMTQHLVAE